MYSFIIPKQNSRTKEVCNDLDYESDIEHRACQSHKRSSDQISSSVLLSHKNIGPIYPNQDIVKCNEQIQSSQHDDAFCKNGLYELINIGKIPSESSINFSSTLPSKVYKNNPQFHQNSEKSNELNDLSQTTSMTNININNNHDIHIGKQQLASNNPAIVRSRAHAKSLSTRISSLKRESKTTRTLSIGKTFTFKLTVFKILIIPFFIYSFWQ